MVLRINSIHGPGLGIGLGLGEQQSIEISLVWSRKKAAKGRGRLQKGFSPKTIFPWAMRCVMVSQGVLKLALSYSSWKVSESCTVFYISIIWLSGT